MSDDNEGSLPPHWKKHMSELSKVVGLVEDLTVKINTIQSDVGSLKHDVGDLRTRIDPSTRVEVAEAKRSVFKPEHGTHAGGEATWTLVKRGNRFFAIGAAHCALWYEAAASEEYTPVCVPSVFGALATKVYVPEHVDGETQYRDVLMVELKKSPQGMQGVPIDFNDKISTVNFELISTFAATSALDLLGSAPERVKLEDVSSTDCFIFHAKQCEPGNSGALLWAMGLDTAVPYGVFFGVDELTLHKKNMLRRGVGVPLPCAVGDGFMLPNGEQMTCYDVASFDKSTFKYMKVKMQKKTKEEKEEEEEMSESEVKPEESEEEDGEKKKIKIKVLREAVVKKAPGKVPEIDGYPCVFINKTFAMNGAHVSGALGCGRAK
uniref:Uncharacterized protein n=1 Tax=Neobodo designis TaxID=312471 RepID=A0A7S1L3J6_NEODS|mmetsp:Transcript_12914/g.40092  ORF Transcript_12914/g.40092 Transcript_12914/m.40092 type:complete len:378 (+) Transcript_12914:52-1185(+)